MTDKIEDLLKLCDAAAPLDYTSYTGQLNFIVKFNLAKVRALLECLRHARAALDTLSDHGRTDYQTNEAREVRALTRDIAREALDKIKKEFE